VHACSVTAATLEEEEGPRRCRRTSSSTTRKIRRHAISSTYEIRLLLPHLRTAHLLPHLRHSAPLPPSPSPPASHQQGPRGRVSPLLAGGGGAWEGPRARWCLTGRPCWPHGPLYISPVKAGQHGPLYISPVKAGQHGPLYISPVKAGQRRKYFYNCLLPVGAGAPQWKGKNCSHKANANLPSNFAISFWTQSKQRCMEEWSRYICYSLQNLIAYYYFNH
jgi:hypothetical protein